MYDLRIRLNCLLKTNRKHEQNSFKNTMFVRRDTKIKYLL